MEGNTVRSPHTHGASAGAALLLAALLTACGSGSGSGSDSGDRGDTSRPTAPRGVTVQASSATSAHVMWKAATDDTAVTGYEVYREGKKVKAVPASKVMIDVEGLTASTAYTFTVRARDAAGNLSAPSAAVRVTTPAPTPADHGPPTRPGKLRGKADGNRAATLSWGGSTDDIGVTAYDVYQEGTRIHTVPGTETTARLTGLRPGTSYTFTVRARDAADTSSPDSNTFRLTTASAPGAPASTAPTGLRARTKVQGKEYTVYLEWAPPRADGEIRTYQLYLDGKMTTTIAWGAEPPTERATYEYTTTEPRGTGHAITLRAQLPDGKWGDFSEPLTVVLGK
ncbi:fibronectin type III domain-containing protein [Streptomyces sp. OfavH-34-F]|uniref:fibronectin type III domain-containing protein n=1 Tax=Streptomyces sp. OfavH-34-F TaxID=2917760 RepID=UPI001EF36A55|nr:fibronectin type III domain-containing protein [Streptomyces sp. OfavH-34-F]MCG7528607.1 fibronectin type III domain-containing protein [Streptomyces sp. OfavH-34-F]